MIRLLAVLVLAGASVNAQTITTQTFGSGANQFSIDFVTIGNPNNIPDSSGSPNYGLDLPSGRGSVSYVYNLGKYEVSRDMVSKASAAGGLGLTLSDMTGYGGSGANRPATGITWTEAAKFVNWLNTSQGYQAAYKIGTAGNPQLWSSGEAGYQANNPFRNNLAWYFLPSGHEWYKGAYGSPSGIWYQYATGSNTAPASVVSGTAADTSVYYSNPSLYPRGPADINNAGGLSPFGTMGQGGNAFEWIEGIFDGAVFRTDIGQVRGGAWWNGLTFLEATMQSHFANAQPTQEDVTFGFRVASVPEPSSLSLLLAGGAVFAAVRRRKLD